MINKLIYLVLLVLENCFMHYYSIAQYILYLSGGQCSKRFWQKRIEEKLTIHHDEHAKKCLNYQVTVSVITSFFCIALPKPGLKFYDIIISFNALV